MTKDINEAAPQKPLFEEFDQVKKEDVLNEKIEVLAYAEMIGEEDKPYGIIAAKKEQGGFFSTTINEMMLARLKEAVQNVGLDDDKTTNQERWFSEPIAVKITQKQSSKNANRKYFAFESASAE